MRCTTERQSTKTRDSLRLVIRLGASKGKSWRKCRLTERAHQRHRLDFLRATSVFTWRTAELDTCTISSTPEDMKRISHNCSGCLPPQTQDQRIAGLSHLHGYSGVSIGDIALLSIGATFDAARPLPQVILTTQISRNVFTIQIRSVGALSPAVHRGR
jgi:hypothetical protein